MIETPRKDRKGYSRRMSSAAAQANLQVEKPFILAFVALLVVYTGVVALTYEKLSRANEQGGVFTEAHSSGIIAAIESSEDVQSTTTNEKTLEYLQYHSFPRHVTEKDSEWIDHPGLIMVSNPSGDLPKRMRVPKLWEDAYASYYNQTTSVREFLGNGNRLMTKEEAASIGSYYTPKSDNSAAGAWETVFASVASYRDYECTPTVKDMYERAEHPERLRVAVIDQMATGHDKPCLTPEKPCEEDSEQTLCKYRHLMDYFHVESKLAMGPVFARHLAHRMYRGEFYAMQVDSHVRFTQNWDTELIDQWKAAGNEYAVLTTYLSDIHNRIDPVTHKGKDDARPIMCNSDFEGSGEYMHLRHGQQPEGVARIKNKPALEPFWAAGFSFARGHFIVQVPYDQHLPMIFQGEEISMGLRGFTYGYDYYAPWRGFVFHIYAIGDNAKKRHIPMFWENNKIYSGVGNKAMKRLNTIIGLKKAADDDWPKQDMVKYGLGTVRNPEKFYKVFGIHVDKNKIEHHLCKFVGIPMMKKFSPALRSDGMGLDYDKIDYEFKDPNPDEPPRRRVHH